ncbi:hypothetical protein EV131_12042 [Rhizobium laguerreae]|uniref:Uncharacterized protein n=1 Tax=Rhizobium laguerreae TaxID=1076926 RepID=A0AAX2QDJ1_9HYPH|nr:hypothetical protein EV131_12042 [Rhizobium laguerreae]
MLNKIVSPADAVTIIHPGDTVAFSASRPGCLQYNTKSPPKKLGD